MKNILSKCKNVAQKIRHRKFFKCRQTRKVPSGFTGAPGTRTPLSPPPPREGPPFQLMETPPAASSSGRNTINIHVTHPGTRTTESGKQAVLGLRAVSSSPT